MTVTFGCDRCKQSFAAPPKDDPYELRQMPAELKELGRYLLCNRSMQEVRDFIERKSEED